MLDSVVQEMIKSYIVSGNLIEILSRGCSGSGQSMAGCAQHRFRMQNGPPDRIGCRHASMTENEEQKEFGKGGQNKQNKIGKQLRKLVRCNCGFM